jgi:hypothetical protein
MKPFLIALAFLILLPQQHCGSPKALPAVVLKGSYDCKTGEVQLTYSENTLNTKTFPTLDDARDALFRAGSQFNYSFDEFKKALLANCTQEQSAGVFRKNPVSPPRKDPTSFGISFNELNSRLSVPEVVPAALLGVLTTTNNRPITVNGASATSGATIPTGAIIETPSGVGATIRLGRLGSLCIAPNTKLSLEFDQPGNLVKVTAIEGCVILHTKKNVSGVINGAQGTLGQIAAATGGSLDVCVRPGAAPLINQGAALDEGAGASAMDCATVGAAAIVRRWRLPRLRPRRVRQPYVLIVLEPHRGRVGFTFHRRVSIDPVKKKQYLKSSGLDGCKQTSDSYVTCPNGKGYLFSLSR